MFIQDKYTHKAIEQVRLGRSFFITGKAGTGKTTLLKEVVKDCRSRGKNIAVSAPTGVAAKNAEGQTLHSLFGLKTLVFIPGKVKRWHRRMTNARVNVIKNLDILIIDEISMVRCDVLDMVDLTLQHFKGNKKAFGGIQVIMFGDLFQLPPVVTDEDKDLLYSHYEKNNPYFFASDVIRRHPFPVLELNKVYRQHDKNFINILNDIREGLYLDSDIEKINKRLKIGYEPSKDESYVYLRTNKSDVKHHNNCKLWRIPGEQKVFWAVKDGIFPKHLYPTDDPLKLKVGAKVMLLRNDNDGLKFVNGTLGIISSIDDDEIDVVTNDGHFIELTPSTWNLYKYEWDEETKSIVPVVCASFTQYPLKLAWAVTIHKSQGMTFRKVIVDAHNSFAAGQVYVALSRCRSLEGIILTSRISESDIMVDPKVLEYMNSVKRIIPDDVAQETYQDVSQSVAFHESSFVTGQYLRTLSENPIAESKKFCLHEGKFFCSVVMTHKGFFLKLLKGGYYFLSELNSEYTLGSIWVQNKRERRLSYDVSYSADGVTALPFGHFIEGITAKTLTYKDLNTNDTFTLSLNTGEKK